MADTYTTLVGAPPDPRSKDWYVWLRKLVNYRVAWCDIPRLTVYYFSQSSGNDTTGDGTILLPYQTIAKAQALHDAGTSDMAFLFKRGDEWNETAGLTFTKARCTVGAYGVGERYFFNRFTVKYNMTGWTVATGNRYTRIETNDIAWVRNQYSRLDNVYSRQSTAALVASNPLSFWYEPAASFTVTIASPAVFSKTGHGLVAGDKIQLSTTGALPTGLSINTDYFVISAGLTADAFQVSATAGGAAINTSGSQSGVHSLRPRVHINSGVSINPNILNLEAVITNTVDGITLSGDGSYAYSGRLDGWGMSRTTSATQKHAYVSNATTTAAVLFRDMEGYYGSSHIATHYVGGSNGGFATFINCIAGYTSYNSASETIFNSFALNGGEEAIFLNCEVAYGTLPSSDWVTATVICRGQALISHTGGGGATTSLIITYGMRIKGSKWGAASPCGGMGNPPTVTTIADVRGFYVGEVFEEHNRSGSGFLIATPSVVRMNGVYMLKPETFGTGALSTANQNGWLINCFVQLDLTFCQGGTNPMAFYNTASENTLKLWGNHIHYKNFTGLTTGLDRDTLSGGSGFSDGGELINNIFSSDSSGTAAYVGFGNAATSSFSNNAYFGMTQSNGVDRGYNLHLNPVALSASPVALRPAVFNSELYHAGTDLSMDYDSRLTLRHTTTPSIGPVDELSYATGLNFGTNQPTVINRQDPIRFIFDEFVGTGDASTTAFLLQNIPTYGSVRLFVAGVRMKLTTDYTISGAALTFTAAPASGAEIVADYHY